MSEAARTNDPRAVSAPLGVTLAPGVRDRIEAFLASFETFSPTLGLLYGRASGAPDHSRLVES